MRIFIGLTEVSGYYSRLKSGFDDLGLIADFFPLQSHRFGFLQNESEAWPLRFARICVRGRVEAIDSRSPTRHAWLVAVFLSRVVFFAWAVARYDVFILGGGSSFFRFREFPILKMFGRRIIYTFHGTDSRPTWMDGYCEGILAKLKPGEEPAPPTAEDLALYHRSNARRRDTVRRVERHADVVVTAPPQAQFHAGPYVIGLAVGLPIDPIENRTGAPHPDRPVRILHSPSFHIGKGTREIREAVERLRSEGLAIDYVEISNRPNHEVREEIARCDFVVDQVYSDTPMAGFAAEAAQAGKPAVVTGYYSTHYLGDLPAQSVPPSAYGRPDQLVDLIRDLVRQPERRALLGARAKAFVEERWSPKAVAERYLRLAEGRIPQEWWYDPARNTYVLGMGASEPRVREVVGAYVERYGWDALGIGHHPQLTDAVRRLIGRHTTPSSP